MRIYEKIKAIARIAIGLSVAVAAFIWLGPAAINAAFEFEATRHEIQRIIQEKTGREIHLDGEIRFRLSTLTPGFRLTRVRLQNAHWSKRPNMLRFDSLDLRLRLLPLLLRGELDFSRIELGSGELALETNREGRGNWRFDAPKQSRPSSATRLPSESPRAKVETRLNWLVEDLGIRDFTLIYENGETGRVRELRINAADLSIGEAKIGGDIDLSYGQSDLRGSIDFHSEARLLSATLRSRLLDLDDFIGTESRVRREARARRGLPQPAHEPLPFQDLFKIDGNVAWRIAELRREAWNIENVFLKAKLKAGRLNLAPLTGSFAGGEFDAMIHANAREQSVGLNFDFQNVDLARLLTDARERSLADAKLSAHVRLHGSGADVPALRGNLQGPIVFETGAIVIDQPVLFATVGPETAKAIRTWADPLPRVECALARIDFMRGSGTSKTLLLDANELAVVGAGDVDLRRERLNLIFTLHSKRLSVFSLASAIPVHLNGSLTHPRIHVATVDVAKKVFLSALELPALPVELIKGIYDVGVAPAKSLCPAARRKAMAGFPE
ncbi:MAG: AsmA family protein [Leptospirales bacterium]|jgi:uncharacterized protein involved in outer membrane biogenesis